MARRGAPWTATAAGRRRPPLRLRRLRLRLRLLRRLPRRLLRQQLRLLLLPAGEGCGCPRLRLCVRWEEETAAQPAGAAPARARDNGRGTMTRAGYPTVASVAEVEACEVLAQGAVEVEGAGGFKEGTPARLSWRQRCVVLVVLVVLSVSWAGVLLGLGCSDRACSRFSYAQAQAGLKKALHLEDQEVEEHAETVEGLREDVGGEAGEATSWPISSAEVTAASGRVCFEVPEPGLFYYRVIIQQPIRDSWLAWLSSSTPASTISPRVPLLLAGSAFPHVLRSATLAPGERIFCDDDVFPANLPGPGTYFVQVQLDFFACVLPLDAIRGDYAALQRDLGAPLWCGDAPCPARPCSELGGGSSEALVVFAGARLKPAQRAPGSRLAFLRISPDKQNCSTEVDEGPSLGPRSFTRGFGHTPLLKHVLFVGDSLAHKLSDRFHVDSALSTKYHCSFLSMKGAPDFGYATLPGKYHSEGCSHTVFAKHNVPAAKLIAALLERHDGVRSSPSAWAPTRRGTTSMPTKERSRISPAR
jgi:hypothetical protein